MKYSRTRRRAGQSLPLFALMMVFIIGMVGLSVDVGSAYSQERRLQSIANAAALTGMNSVVSVPFGTKASNEQVWESIRRATSGNQVNNSGKDYKYWVDYIVAGGERIRLADWDGNSPEVAPGLAPDRVVRMQVTMEHRLPAYFTPVVGWDDFTVNVEGSACLGGYGLGVLSLGVPQTLVREKDDSPYHVIEDAAGNILPTDDPDWGNWQEMYGMRITFPIENGVSNVSGTLIPWLSWEGANGVPDLHAGMTYPGTLHEGFKEATPGDPGLPNTAPAGKLTLGDWVDGKTGKKAAVINSEFPRLKADETIFALPIYDQVGGQGQTSFHITRVGKFKMINYDGGGNDAFMQLEYLGDKSYAITECVEPPPIIPPTYNLTGQAQFAEVYGDPQPHNMPTTYDIVIVMDTSGSMNRDWYDRETTNDPRMDDARQAIKNIVQGYDVKADPDARMALVTFGDLQATRQVDWSTAECPEPDPLDPDDECEGHEKWTKIQEKADTLTADGATPGPAAFEEVQKLLQNKRPVPSGKHYGQVVIFATDGVFNVCGTYTEALLNVTNVCTAAHVGKVVPPYDTPLLDGTLPETYTNSADYNMAPGRPIWQAQQVARQIKATGARIFMIALTPKCLPTIPDCFNPTGIPEMSSGSGYMYEADDAAAMTRIYDRILEKLPAGAKECSPYEVPLRGAGGAKITLTQPQNSTWSKETTADADGNWSFSGLPAGLYAVTVEPSFEFKSPKDSKSRTYSHVVNARNPSEVDKATVDVNGKRPDGATFVNDLNLYIDRDEDGVPKNGCWVPKAP